MQVRLGYHPLELISSADTYLTENLQCDAQADERSMHPRDRFCSIFLHLMSLQPLSIDGYRNRFAEATLEHFVASPCQEPAAFQLGISHPFSVLFSILVLLINF